jgi:hypothetical protein
VIPVNALKLLEKVPMPDPSVVLLSFVVGFIVVLQHTPRLETASPLSLVTFPPDIADDGVIEVISVVVTSGTAICLVVNLTWFP